MSKLRDDAVAQIDCLWNYYKAERALADDLAAALDTALDLIATDDDIAVLNQLRDPLARYREARQQ